MRPLWPVQHKFTCNLMPELYLLQNVNSFMYSFDLAKILEYYFHLLRLLAYFFHAGKQQPLPFSLRFFSAPKCHYLSDISFKFNLLKQDTNWFAASLCQSSLYSVSYLNYLQNKVAKFDLTKVWSWPAVGESNLNCFGPAQRTWASKMGFKHQNSM